LIETLALCERLPLVPINFTVDMPKAAPWFACRVAIEVPEPVIDEGWKVAVTPVGSPVAVRVMLPLKPPLWVAVMVNVVLPDRPRVREDGLAEMVKSGGVRVVTEIAVDCAEAFPAASYAATL